MKKTGEVVQVEPAIKPLGEKGGYSIGHLPVVEFGTADILKRWVQGMRAAGVSRSTEAKAWSVISSEYRRCCRPPCNGPRGLELRVA
jgi:hypothetical protein